MYISEVFKALGDETRLRILNLLSDQELCVCQINEVLKMSQPNTSKHLNRLRYTGLIVCRKVSQWCFYSINKGFISKNPLFYQCLLSEWAADSVFTGDKQQLNEIVCKFECCQKILQKISEEPPFQV